jgi:hypothetical protein
VEFDYGSVLCLRTLIAEGKKTVIEKRKSQLQPGLCRSHFEKRKKMTVQTTKKCLTGYGQLQP